MPYTVLIDGCSFTHGYELNQGESWADLFIEDLNKLSINVIKRSGNGRSNYNICNSINNELFNKNKIDKVVLMLTSPNREDIYSLITEEKIYNFVALSPQLDFDKHYELFVSKEKFLISKKDFITLCKSYQNTHELQPFSKFVKRDITYLINTIRTLNYLNIKYNIMFSMESLLYSAYNKYYKYKEIDYLTSLIKIEKYDCLFNVFKHDFNNDKKYITPGKHYTKEIHAEFYKKNKDKLLQF